MLRVLTLNIWNLSGDWRARRVETVEWIDRLAPDVVCLQEVVESDAGGNQAEWLAEHCAGDWFVAYAGRPVMDGVLFGNAVLSRWPIDAQADDDVPSTPEREDETQRFVLHARTNGLDVFSTHLSWQYADGVIREKQVLKLAEVVADRADTSAALPPILAGDFNAEPDSTEMRFLTGLTSLEGRSVYFQDAWRVAGGRGPGYTWENRNPHASKEYEPDRRIDYILVGWRRNHTGAGRVEACRVVCDRVLTEDWASDHHGLLAELAT
ncbi:MAG TPA: endonuclease/exonuclease/phosphatase family protein [Acidimicrobiales bacterium]|nr:endonuclease/exonuclease/phosphatase family protein [Acidimicrobiales bacterium]